MESIEHTSLEIQCLKIIAIIQIFGDKTLVKNDFETIACSLVVERKENINEALESLVKKKLIFFKEINNVYNLAEATDFDLEKELAPYLIATFPNKTELNSLLK